MCISNGAIASRCAPELLSLWLDRILGYGACYEVSWAKDDTMNARLA